VHTTTSQIYSTHNSYYRSEEVEEEEEKEKAEKKEKKEEKEEEKEEEEGEEEGEGDEVCVRVRRHTRHVQWGTSNVKRLACATAHVQISSKCLRTYCELFSISYIAPLTSSVTHLGPTMFAPKKKGPRSHLFNALAKDCGIPQLSVIIGDIVVTSHHPLSPICFLFQNSGSCRVE
jgi:hypothetical protein